MKFTILTLSLLMSFSSFAQEKKTAAQIIEEVQALKAPKKSASQILEEVEARNKMRDEIYEKSGLEGCEMSKDRKEITCGDKIYELSSRINDLQRMHHKLDNMKDAPAPASKSQKVSGQ